MDESRTTKAAASEARLAPIVAGYASTTGAENEDTTTVLADLLADLHHWADAHQIDWDAALTAGEKDYTHEVDPAGMRRAQQIQTRLIAVSTAITDLYPTATFYSLISTDQNHGYILTGVGFDGGDVITADSATFTALADQLSEDLWTLTWGAFGDKNKDSSFDVDLTTHTIIR